MARRLSAMVAATLLFAGLTLISASAQTPTPSPTDDKVVFVYGDTSEPSSLNPFKGYLATDFYFWAWGYHLPTTFGVEDLGAVPDLVTDVETSEDGQTFTYTIRDGVRWSDGEPVSAQDVEFTLNLYKEKHAYLPQNYLRLVDSIEAPDDSTVVLHTTQPTSLYAGGVPYMYTYILPEHVWSQYADAPRDYENLPMVGSGPFVVTEYERGQFVRMERNPHWSGPEPHMDEIIYRIFKNEDAEAEALRSGEIDFAYFDSANVYNSIKDEPNIGTHVGTIPSFDEIGMNTGSAYQEPAPGFEPHGDGHPALTDPVVRRAIRMAVDSEEITDRIHLGYALPGTSIIPPVSIEGARWEPSDEERIAFDPEGATQLLEEAGYVDTDGDGIREMSRDSLEPGRPLEFRYYTQTNDQNTIKTAPFVRSWLEDIGIGVDVTAMSSGRLGDELVAGTYDLFHWGWIPDPDPDSILSYFQCEERPPDENTYGNNDAYYCNPEYDRMYAEQRSTLDTQERLSIIHEMQRLFYEDSPYVVLWYSPIYQAYRTDRFTGFQPQPAPQGDLLTGYSRDAALTIRPAGQGTAARETRGIPAGVWIGAVAGVVVLVLLVLLLRRRSAEERA
ncbi:MAG TPA: ABC transporter substrate-binding protein [Actinomycetota bacterium]|nr:ABC transporter substrate-binding protein [Actinomycetota bacterium]